MSNCDIDIATHKKASSSQQNRMLKALRTDFVAVDERSIVDLINSTNTLSKHINYYNKDNILLGTWDSFFQWETTSILAQIATLDIDKLVAEFQVKKRALLFIPVLADQKKHIIPFFRAIAVQITHLFDKIKHLPADFEIRAYFEGTHHTVKNLLLLIKDELKESDDLLFLLQHHLFNKNIQNLFGLLKQWKSKSKTKLDENLENYPKHSPQYALYLAFLKLFGFAQENINQFTQQHLDFYYKEILRLHPEAAQPDYVHLHIEPHKNSAPFLIEKGAKFQAGKDSNGHPKHYQTTGEVAINQAKIRNIYGSTIKDSQYYFDERTDLNATGKSWKAFPQEEEQLFSEIGFALASPMLFMKGGNRFLFLTFWDAFENKITINTTDFDFYLTAEDAWHPVTMVSKLGDKVYFTIPTDTKGIIPFNTEIHEGVALNTPFPVLKITPKTGKLTNVTFTKVKLEVLVTNYNHFKLYSETGEIDHTKTFQPFSAVPQSGNAFEFACNEFFQKKNAMGFLKMVNDGNWYIPNQTRLSYLQNGVWSADNKWTKQPFINMTNTSPIPYNFSEDTPINADDTNGYAKIILNNTAYDKNGYLEKFIAGTKMDDPVLPYIPTITEILFNYYATETIDLSSTENNSDYDFFHIYPKGFKQLQGSEASLLPVIQNEGELVIGFNDIKGGNSINLLFQVAEGSANPRQDAITLQWEYLSKDQWIPFSPSAIGDNTYDLTQSGIVTINSPQDLYLDKQTLFPSSSWWIKISATARIDAICDLVGIHTQALKAILVSPEENGTHFTENTPAKTISKAVEVKNEIKKIAQPYPSFGGKTKETDTLFYQRTSEHLRHKGRAISKWDYERLILDNFPEVFQVKCLNHYRYDTIEQSSTSAGYLTIIPVAKATTLQVHDYWKPIVDLGTMKRIHTFLKQKTSPHVRIAVKPPKLEKLELDFKVKYIEIPGADTHLYTQQLQQAINTYLSPWAYTENNAVHFQETIEKSRLIHLLEQQSYVDYITAFKVNHIILMDDSDLPKHKMNDVKKIIPKTEYTLFVPHTHNIHTITNACCL